MIVPYFIFKMIDIPNYDYILLIKNIFIKIKHLFNKIRGQNVMVNNQELSKIIIINELENIPNKDIPKIYNINNSIKYNLSNQFKNKIHNRSFSSNI